MPPFQYQSGAGYQGNPQGATNFNVKPGNNMLPGLTGLNKAMGVMGAQMKEKKKKEQAEATYTDIRTRMEAAQQLPDYERAQEYAKLHGEYPAYSKWVDELGGYHQDAAGKHPTKKAVGTALQNVALDPENAIMHLDQGITRAWQLGSKDTSRLESYRKEWVDNPALAKNKSMSVWSMFDKEGFADYQAAKPDKEDGYWAKPRRRDWTDESRAEMRRTGDESVLVRRPDPPDPMAALAGAMAQQSYDTKQAQAGREQVEFDQRQQEVARETESRADTDRRREMAHGSVDRAMALEGTGLTVDDEDYMRSNIDALPPNEAYERNKEFIEAKRTGNEAAVKKRALAKQRAALPAWVAKKYPNKSTAEIEEIQSAAKSAADAGTAQDGRDAAQATNDGQVQRKEAARTYANNKTKARNASNLIKSVMGPGTPDLQIAKLDKIYGRGEALYPEFARSQEGQDMRVQLKKIIATLQLASAKDAKGQGSLSDAERTMMANAATILGDETISPALAHQELMQVYSVFNGEANLPMVTSQADYDALSVGDRYIGRDGRPGTRLEN